MGYLTMQRLTAPDGRTYPWPLVASADISGQVCYPGMRVEALPAGCRIEEVPPEPEPEPETLPQAQARRLLEIEAEAEARFAARWPALERSALLAGVPLDDATPGLAQDAYDRLAARRVAGEAIAAAESVEVVNAVTLGDPQ